MNFTFEQYEESAQFIFEMTTYYENVKNAVTHAPDEQELNEYLDAQKVYRVKHILLKTVDDSGELLADSAVSEKKIQAEDLRAVGTRLIRLKADLVVSNRKSEQLA